MGKVHFDCGCAFNIVDPEAPDMQVYEAIPRLPLCDVDIFQIPFDCPRTWQLFASGQTKGIFQLEGHLGKIWAKKVQPTSLEDLGALVALLRPGCLRAMSGDPPKSMTQRYADRKNLLEEVEYLHPSLEPLLNKTYGVLTYQEQAMKISVALAGFNEQEADVLRKAIGKKKADVMAKVQGGFIDGCKATGIVNPEQAEEIFGWIRESQRYSFNKSHAVCYGEGAYWSAYCKAHMPLQFYCSYLRGSAWKQDKFAEIKELVSDARQTGINICTPDLRTRQEEFHIVDDQLRFGLSNIKQVGEAALNRLHRHVKEAELILRKNVKDWTWEDYLMYFSDKIPSTVNVALIAAGAIDFLGVPRRRMKFEIARWSQLTDKERDWVVQRQYPWMVEDYQNGDTAIQHWPSLAHALTDCARTKKEGGGCHTAKRVDVVLSIRNLLQCPPNSLEDPPDEIAFDEERYLGAGITYSRVDGCMDASKANHTCKEIAEGAKADYMLVAVEITNVKKVFTKRGKTPGQAMAFITAEDNTCALDDLVCFPDKWKMAQSLLYQGNTVLIQVKRSNSSDSSIIEKVWQI